MPEDILKYYRHQAQDAFDEVLGAERISAGAMGPEGTVIVGTEVGYLHLITPGGSTAKIFQPFDGIPVTAISVEVWGADNLTGKAPPLLSPTLDPSTGGCTIACTADNGAIMVYQVSSVSSPLSSPSNTANTSSSSNRTPSRANSVSVSVDGSIGKNKKSGGDRQSLVQLGEAQRAVCLQPTSAGAVYGGTSSGGTTFLVGSVTGQLTKHTLVGGALGTHLLPPSMRGVTPLSPSKPKSNKGSISGSISGPGVLGGMGSFDERGVSIDGVALESPSSASTGLSHVSRTKAMRSTGPSHATSNSKPKKSQRTARTISEVLFAGAGSAVGAVAWRGDLVVWADGAQVRLMDVRTQDAVCYLDIPSIGMSPLPTASEFPCSLFWASDTDLLVGWVDGVRHLELLAAGDLLNPYQEHDRETGNNTLANASSSKTKKKGQEKDQGGNSIFEEGSRVIARTVNDWETDCIICGLSVLDESSVAVLGYVPAEEGDADARAVMELQVCSLRTGELLSCDVLPLKEGGGIINGNGPNIGPAGYMLLSTYDQQALSGRALQWRLSDLDTSSSSSISISNGISQVEKDEIASRVNGAVDVNMPRGLLLAQAAALAPQMVVLCAGDMVAGCTRGVDDHIGHFLANMQLKEAAQLAAEGRAALRTYAFSDLLTLYVGELLGKGPQFYAEAALECGRLLLLGAAAVGGAERGASDLWLQQDLALWERWTYAFLNVDVPISDNSSAAPPLGERGQALAALARYMPCADEKSDFPYALPAAVYEVVLSELVQHRAQDLFTLVKRLAPLPAPGIHAAPRPPLFDETALLARLSALTKHAEPFIGDSVAAAVTGIDRGGQRWLMVAQAHLHRRKAEHAKALDCYLDSASCVGYTPPSSTGVGHANGSAFGSTTITQADTAGMEDSKVVRGKELNPYEAYEDLWDMIERDPQSCFPPLQSRLYALSLLSAPDGWLPLFLVKHKDKIPISSVVRQLAGAAALSDSAASAHVSLLVRVRSRYLAALFVEAPEAYNVQECAEFHALQVGLLAQFAPPFTTKTKTSKGIHATSPSTSTSVNASAAGEEEQKDGWTDADAAGCDKEEEELDSSLLAPILKPSTKGGGVSGGGGRNKQSLFLYFLKNSNFAPLDVALRACEQRNPPLYHEMVYVHATTGDAELALDILLKQMRDMSAAFAFIESGGVRDDSSTSYTGGSNGNGQGMSRSTAPSQWDPSMSQKLWMHLTEYALEAKDGDFLAQVLDFAGLSTNINPALIISRLPKGVSLPHLRKRLLRVAHQYKFRSFATDRCNDILAGDTLGLQRNLNSLQRRAVKVDPAATTRCLICVKPISLPPQPQDLPSQQPQSNSTQSTDGSNNSNNSNGSASQGEDKNRTRERRRQERQRKGGLSSGVLSGGGGTIWGRPLSEAAQPTGVLIFANKQVYHRSCYLAQQQQQ